MNARPHIGHALEHIITDILARYHRAQGEEVLFIAGSDEHGDKILGAAQKEGLSPKVFVDGNVQIFHDLLKALNISHDRFIRTSDSQQHWPGAQKLWRELDKAGDIYKASYEGLYCVGCEAFITEKELVEGKCIFHDKEPERIKEENYFFKLSKYVPLVVENITSGKFLILPESRKHEMLELLKNTQDLSISRSIREVPWGIPVPGDDTQLMYVWIDALSNYISVLGYGSTDETDFNTYWPADMHVVGKDIARFHAIFWPAFLLSAGYPLPKSLLVHGFITSGGKKMSKSLGNSLYTEEFIEEYGADALRYYCASAIPTMDDGDLTRERFKEIYNAHLANGLGNLVSRTLKMAEQYFEGKVTGGIRGNIYDTSHEFSKPESISQEEFLRDPELAIFTAEMNQYRINSAVASVNTLVNALDGYIARTEPFKLIKTNREETEKIIWTLVSYLFTIQKMITPIMPDTAETLTNLLGTPQENPEGTTIYTVKTPKAPLFLRKD